ncbi:MAG: AraC family transcriptional regulator [Thermotaleaceae bacterium]
MRNLLCETRTYTETSYTHCHSYSQLILPLQGKLSIKTDEHELNLDEEHFFFLPPKRLHAYHSNCNNRFLVLDIPNEINSIGLEQTAGFERYEVLNEKWKAIRYLLLEESKRADSRTLNDLVNYAVSLLRENIKPISIQYIHDNIEKQIPIQMLAAMENFNVSYYVEWFNRKTGMTPNRYIQKLRIEKAKKYLIETEGSILEISQLVGYEQQSSLSRLFKNHENISPNDYRKIYRKNG